MVPLRSGRGEAGPESPRLTAASAIGNKYPRLLGFMMLTVFTRSTVKRPCNYNYLCRYSRYQIPCCTLLARYFQTNLDPRETGCRHL